MFSLQVDFCFDQNPQKKTSMEALKDCYLLDSRFVSTFLRGHFEVRNPLCLDSETAFR